MGWRSAAGSATMAQRMPSTPRPPAARVDPRRLAALRERGRPACSTCCAPHVGSASRCWSSPTIGAMRRSSPASPFAAPPARLGGCRASKCSSTALSIATTARITAPADRLRATLHDRRRRRVPGSWPSEAPATDRRGRTLARRRDRPRRSTASSRRPGSTATARSKRCADCGIPIAEDHLRVWSPATGDTARERPGDHLGEPDAPAPRLLAGRGRGASPCADRGPAHRRPPARCPPSRAGAEHRHDVRGRPAQNRRAGAATRTS